MQTQVSIAQDIYMISVNDRRTALFENLWPIPHGVSYNSYVILDEHCALLDTIEFGSEGSYLDRVEAILEGRPLEYLIVNHMEPDHSGEIGSVLKRYPNIKVIGNALTKKMLDAYFGDLTANFQEVRHGDTLSLGTHTLQFFLTPWVHWPETMVTYEQSTKVLFSADAFGTFGTTDGAATDADTGLSVYVEDMRRYYSNIVGKYGNMVQKALAKLSGLEITTLCPLHGPVWRRQAGEVIALYDKWSKGEADDAVMIVYASMYNNTAHMADYIASCLKRRGVADVRVYDVSKTHMSYLISEMWRCRYVMLGSCAYNGDMFPAMEQLCSAMTHYGLKNRDLAIFGSCSFGGGGVRALKKFAETVGWNIVGEPTEVTGRATRENLEKFLPLANAMADHVLKVAPKQEPLACKTCCRKG